MGARNPYTCPHCSRKLPTSAALMTPGSNLPPGPGGSWELTPAASAGVCATAPASAAAWAAPVASAVMVMVGGGGGGLLVFALFCGGCGAGGSLRGLRLPNTVGISTNSRAPMVKVAEEVWPEGKLKEVW